MKSRHVHPKPAQNRLVQYGAAAAILIVLAASVLQVVLALTGIPGGLFFLTAFVTLFLIPPLVMLTTSTPAVTLDETGVTIEPVIWKPQVVAWQDVRAVKDYPLLPPPDAEIGRKLAVGRKNYRPAEGKMLVILGLPVQYRITGFFAGEGFTPVIAVTNRSHTEYDKLVKKLMLYWEENAQHGGSEAQRHSGEL